MRLTQKRASHATEKPRLLSQNRWFAYQPTRARVRSIVEGNSDSMRVTVAFQDETAELTVADSALVGHWQGPLGMPTSEVAGRLVEVLEAPTGFPPLRLALVPGDRVTIALGSGISELGAILGGLFEVFESCEVTSDCVTIVIEADLSDDLVRLVPPGVIIRRHDPDDRTNLAYLASTASDRRVYLDRNLTDADIVIPIGRLAHDPVVNDAGPWSVLFPGLSDTETLRAYHQVVSAQAPEPGQTSPLLTESIEVSWLLGCQFQIGVVAGTTGIVGVVAGATESVLADGAVLLDRSWSYRTESRSELVIVGIGRAGMSAGIDEVARGLATATRLVQRGGKIVVLSRASGPIGTAVKSLRNLENPSRIASKLRHHEKDPDHATAQAIGRALAWADVYFLSRFDPGLIDDLGMIPLDHPREAARLAGLSNSCQVVSHADLVRAMIVGESEGDHS